METMAGGASFCAKPVIIACAGHRNPHQIRVLIHRFDDCHQKDEKLNVSAGVRARIQQVNAGIGDHGPVVVLAGTIDAFKWFS